MTPGWNHTRRLGGACCLALLLIAGCSSRPRVTTAASAENIRKLRAAYLAAVTELKRPPTSEDELRPFLAKEGDPATLLRSPNDGEPFVVLYGADPRTGKDLKPLIIAYEKVGSNGRRLVFTAMGVMEMTNQAFQEANFPPGHKPN